MEARQPRKFPWMPASVELEGRLAIDNTGYQNIEVCARKAAIVLSFKREAVSEPWDLVAGRAVHEALDVRQQALMAGEKDSGRLQTLMEATLESFFDRLKTPLPPDEYRTLGRLKDVVGNYQQAFGVEPFEILASEQAVERELGSVRWWDSLLGEWCRCSVFWQGKLDGLWRNPDTGELCVKDTKTSSRDEFAGGEEGEWSKGEAKYQMSGQLQGYCWLLSMPERPVTGAVLDAVIIRKPVQRVTVKTPPQNECKRRFFSWTPAQIEEWRRDTLENISQWLTACAKPGQQPPPMIRSSCAWPQVCQFYCSCVQPTEAARMEKLAGARFRERTWDPMKEGKLTAGHVSTPCNTTATATIPDAILSEV